MATKAFKSEKIEAMQEELVNRIVTGKEKEEELRPLLEEYTRIFHLNLEEILASDFSVIEADPQKSYKQIYAAV